MRWATFEMRRGEPDVAGPRLLESFAYRAKTRKREITKLYPLAHLAREGRREDVLHAAR
jgi:hypothetical protein